MVSVAADRIFEALDEALRSCLKTHKFFLGTEVGIGDGHGEELLD